MVSGFHAAHGDFDFEFALQLFHLRLELIKNVPPMRPARITPIDMSFRLIEQEACSGSACSARRGYRRARSRGDVRLPSILGDRDGLIGCPSAVKNFRHALGDFIMSSPYRPGGQRAGIRA